MIELPDQFSEVLKQDARMNAGVNALLQAVDEILGDNQMPFFPCFTDHGCKHVENLFKTEVMLVPAEVWKAGVLNSRDVAVLTCATLLHDLGMHIREGGFFKLLQDKRETLSWGVKDVPWKQLWDDYSREVRQFSTRMIRAIFGNHVIDFGRLLEVPHEKEKLTYEHRLLIGEFLRRHHPRLAQEIAHFGFPGTSDEMFPAVVDELAETGIIIGSVARSHGYAIRTLQEQIVAKHRGSTRQYEVAVLYHAALMRIADYLQMDKERGPFVLFQLKEPVSPLSIDEWKKHAAIDYINFEHAEDRLAVFIALNHSHSLRTHVQIEQLINGLQQELDMCAAVLSETYGRLRSDLKKLQLARTRVASNLHSDELERSLPYIATKCGISVNPEIIPLMVKPLYGEHPEIGIRELVQNALDAVRERESYCERHGLKSEAGQLYNNDCDVQIRIEEVDEGNWKLIVTDTGIGMSVTTIIDYFLRAGASYRQSEEWVREFVNEDGRSTVLRAGRFGVGFFAAFLVGRSVHVTTRHITSEDNGIEFKAGPDGDLIELRKAAVPQPFGTRIEIVIDRENVSELGFSSERHRILLEAEKGFAAWDWYSLCAPTVKRVIAFADGHEIEVQQKHVIGCETGAAFPWWNRIWPEDYGEVQWNYKQKPKIIVNGIRVGDVEFQKCHDADYVWRDKWQGFTIKTPSISIADPDGRLPLALRRDRFTGGHVPFEQELLDDIACDFLAYALVYGPSEPCWTRPYSHPAYFRVYPLLKLGQKFSPMRWFCTCEGVAPLTLHFLQVAMQPEIVFCGEMGGKWRAECWSEIGQQDFRIACAPVSLRGGSEEDDEGYVSFGDSVRMIELLPLASEGLGNVYSWKLAFGIHNMVHERVSSRGMPNRLFCEDEVSYYSDWNEKATQESFFDTSVVFAK